MVGPHQRHGRMTASNADRTMKNDSLTVLGRRQITGIERRQRPQHRAGNVAADVFVGFADIDDQSRPPLMPGHDRRGINQMDPLTHAGKSVGIGRHGEHEMVLLRAGPVPPGVEARRGYAAPDVRTILKYDLCANGIRSRPNTVCLVSGANAIPK